MTLLADKADKEKIEHELDNSSEDNDIDWRYWFVD